MRVIGVRFRDVGNICYYDPDDIDIDVNDRVIAETDRGVECGRVILGPRELSENYTNPIKKIIKKADIEDVVRFEENLKKEKEAFDICKAKIIELDLPMKLISAEYTFDNAKVLFYFTAECRVDFRELVKILASIFRVRIELRQVGVRDETKMVGGMGSCGRALCCHSYLSDFVPVSIKMAKDQGLSLNPAKISGVCGRLFCCLKYEAQGYADAVKKMPSVGWLVKDLFTEKKGKVIDVNHLLENIKVEFEDKTVGVLAEGDYKVIKASKKDNSQQANQEKLDKEALAELKKLEREK